MYHALIAHLSMRLCLTDQHQHHQRTVKVTVPATSAHVSRCRWCRCPLHTHTQTRSHVDTIVPRRTAPLRLFVRRTRPPYSPSNHTSHTNIRTKSPEAMAKAAVQKSRAKSHAPDKHFTEHVVPLYIIIKYANCLGAS